jgi:integrase
MFWDSKNKSYVISWPDPKRKGKSLYKRMPKGTSKEFAQKQEYKIRSGLIESLDNRREKTFEEWSLIWLEQYACIHKTPSSVVKDKSTLVNHLLPRFGEWFASSITVSEVQKLQSELLQKGLAPQTVNNIVACLSVILSFLTSTGVLNFNPCKLVRRIRKLQSSPSFWTFEEVQKFMVYCHERDFETFQIVALALTTGLRPGEIQGLLRDCFDFHQGLIHVRRNYCTKTKMIVEYTKTKRDRKVPVPREILDLLSDKYHLTSKDKIFDFSCNSFGKRKIQKYAKECGVTPIRFHDLRHTFASHLAIKNVHQVKIRDLLGHTKLDTTNIYMHLSQDDKKGLTDVLTEGMSWVDHSAAPTGNVVNLFGR